MDGAGTGLPVVVGVDGSRSALAAVRWGAAEASRRGAQLGGVVGLMVGSVAFGLGAHAACPVAVVRGRADANDGPVVVGVETSPNSDVALAFAFEEAAARQASLVAVHTWWDLLIDPVALLEQDAVLREERAKLADRVAGWQQKYPDVAVELVVGSHAHGRVTGLLFGSVGHALVHRADCPVVLVRPETASEGRVPAA